MRYSHHSNPRQAAQLHLVNAASDRFREAVCPPAAACTEFIEGKHETNMKRLGIILCMVSALVTMASVVTIAARLT